LQADIQGGAHDPGKGTAAASANTLGGLPFTGLDLTRCSVAGSC